MLEFLYKTCPANANKLLNQQKDAISLEEILLWSFSFAKTATNLSISLELLSVSVIFEFS